MSRVTIASDDKGEIKFETATSTGRGKLGQIKVATLFGRSYSLALTNETKSLNRGSFIDFLNAKTKNTNLPELKKGWFFGYFGSSDKEIKEVFDKIYSNTDKADLPTTKEDAPIEASKLKKEKPLQEKPPINDKKKALTELKKIKDDDKLIKKFFKGKITKNLKNDHDFRLEAMKIKPSTIELTGTDLAENSEFMTKALEIAPKETLCYALENERSLHKNLKKDPNFMLKAIHAINSSDNLLKLNELIIMYENIHKDLLRNRDFIFKLTVSVPEFIESEQFDEAIDLIFPKNENSEHPDPDRKNFLLGIAIANKNADDLIVDCLKITSESLIEEKAKRQKELAEQKNNLDKK